jgi:hypothetical protein
MQGDACAVPPEAICCTGEHFLLFYHCGVRP